MKNLIFLIIGFALLVLLYQFGARTRAPVIERDIQTRTSAALDLPQFANVSVATDGRDVTLSGRVSEANLAVDAERIALDVYGVRVVDNEIQTARSPTTQFCHENGTVTLGGDIPPQPARYRNAADVRTLFPNSDVEIDLTEYADTAGTGLGPFLDLMLTELAQMDSGCMTVVATVAQLTGAVRSQIAAQRIRQQVESRPADDFIVTYEFDVPSLSDEAQTCQDEYNRRLEPGEHVLFDFDSAELHQEGRMLLDEIAEIGELCPDVGVLITGHTDSVGDDQYNFELSRERAGAVVDYLTSIGVERSRMTPIGFGETQPVADNSTEAGRAINRRIEFRVREN